jgi:hydrogenase/urease accessory protein HupE
MMRVGHLLTLLLSLILAVSGARADELRPGYLELRQRSAGEWRMVWKAPIKGGLASNARPALPAFCTQTLASRTIINGAVVTISNVTCTQALAGVRVGLTGLDATFTDALMRIAPLGASVQAARLTPDAPIAEIAVKVESVQVGKTYFLLGVEHILEGFDHLLFVLSLVLLLTGGWQIAKAVTAFTVAHSITLVATSLHLLSVPRQPVEVCIALSIVFLAVEIVKSRQGAPRLSERIPWVVAFAFGLLHGFGFAGALAEIGLPEGEVPMALFSFNLGVEAGQLIIVGAGLILLAITRYMPAVLLETVRKGMAYAIGSVAAFWMIERMLT